MRTHLLATTALAAALLAGTSSTRAQTWTGNVSSDWFTADNWSPATVPSTGGVNINTASPNPTVIGVPGATSGSLGVGGGILTIQNGGTLTSSSSLNVSAGSTATVTGAGSSWVQTAAGLLVGNGSMGTLIIADGGTVRPFAATSIGILGGQGTVLVTGANSSMAGSSLTVGSLGGSTGTLTVADGGTVSEPTGTNIAQASGGLVSVGTVTVTGPGSSFTTSTLNVGLTAGGTGILTIADGGTVTATSVQVATVTGSTGTLNIGAPANASPAAPGTLQTQPSRSAVTVFLSSTIPTRAAAMSLRPSFRVPAASMCSRVSPPSRPPTPTPIRAQPQ